jgi:hypothetical protein
MNWKEFLKPSWRKFSIFQIFLSIYLLILASWYYQLLTETIPRAFSVHILYLTPLTGGLSYFLQAILHPIFFVYWYLLSCLIDFTYKKLVYAKK